MTLEDLDRRISFIDSQFRISDEAGRKATESLKFDYPDKLPEDPFSKEYLEEQWRRYEFMTGHPYSIAHEDGTVTKPFPFVTNSPKIISNYIRTLANLIELMSLKKDDKLLEFGIGGGTSTELFLKCGYNVLGVDVNQKALEEVRENNKNYQFHLKLRCEDMMKFKTFDKFNAIVFVQSFHHALDHRTFLNQLREFLAPDAAIYFCIEPIVTELDMPWGVANIGQSLWSLRKDGWFETVFREDYFFELLKREGFKPEKFNNIYKASKL